MASLLAAIVLVFSPPVGGGVVRGFQPPGSTYGPGHVGLDYAVAPGEAVHAVGDGVVVFAGRVGATLHVTVRHPDGQLTTVSFLRTVAVHRGDVVRRGAVVGTAGGVDPLDPRYDGTRLLLTLRIGGRYVDPSGLFAPPDLAASVHLTRWDDTAGTQTGPATEPAAGPGAPPLALQVLAATVLRSG